MEISELITLYDTTCSTDNTDVITSRATSVHIAIRVSSLLLVRRIKGVGGSGGGGGGSDVTTFRSFFLL